MKKLALAAVAVSPVLSFAATTGPDLTPLTNAIDFSTVITAVLAIGGLLAGVYVAIRGAKTVLSMIRG
ncbi:MAG: hypothetical protein EPO09_12480 [Aquabacterium sp.]|uniref:major capsid protein n=1 Tax=Aquabacterium sp. TaxID=1872578 RepID=UPI00120212C8|nr:major capsid protein [Aquabacterium sp.]TAK93485.1 MAG: hypothetical protein EPO09_12480 [Aquabacterium sp.]